jgi:hypothetical protein
MRETVNRPGSAGGFGVYRHSARSHQAPQRVAGPFPTWREAFLAQCLLAQEIRAAGGAYADRFMIRVDRPTVSRAA